MSDSSGTAEEFKVILRLVGVLRLRLSSSGISALDTGELLDLVQEIADRSYRYGCLRGSEGIELSVDGVDSTVRRVSATAGSKKKVALIVRRPTLLD